MNYIYDIVLNFNKEYYNFFEWNKRDNIVNVKKIPLFLVNNDTFKMFKYDNVTVCDSFINLIKDKTYTYSRVKLGNTALVTNGKEVIGVLFNDKGNLIKRSSLLLDEEEEVLNEINAYHTDLIEYAHKRRVWICSPTTLISTFTIIQVLLKNMERDKYASIIHDELNKLGVEFGRYKERWDKLSRSIETVNKDIENIHVTTYKINKRFDSISKVELGDKKEIE